MARRAKLQRRTVDRALSSYDQPILSDNSRVIVTITRSASKLLDEHDNLSSSAKHVVDEVARWLGVDDSDPIVEWRYSQVKSTVREKKLVTRNGITQRRMVPVETVTILVQVVREPLRG